MVDEYYCGEQIYEGFTYPKSYVDFVSAQERQSIEPWWLIGSSEGLYQICHNLLNVDLESGIRLIPFAKSEETKALAFFDEGGRVYFYIGEQSLKDVDWNSRFHLKNFDEWLWKVKSGEI